MSKNLTRREFLLRAAAFAGGMILGAVRQDLLDGQETEGILLETSDPVVLSPQMTVCWGEITPDGKWHYHTWRFDGKELISYTIDDAEQMVRRPLPENKWCAFTLSYSPDHERKTYIHA